MISFHVIRKIITADTGYSSNVGYADDFQLDFYNKMEDNINNSTRHASDASGPGRVFFFYNHFMAGGIV